MPPAIVARLALLQVTVVFFGVLFTAAFMRMAQATYPGWPMPVLPEWVQHHGVWLFLLPIAWTTAATLTVHELDDLPQIRQEWMVAGYCLLIGLAAGLAGTVIGALVALTNVRGPIQAQ